MDKPDNCTLTSDELIKWDCPLADNILKTKCKNWCDEKIEYDYTHMTFSEFNNWTPTEEDIPDLVESIRFWSDLKPKGNKETWTDLQFKLFCETVKKEKMLLAALGKIKHMSSTVLEHLYQEKRRYLKNKLKNARTYKK
jgi:hypothetical protein